MRRREFIAGLGGAAATLPVVARAQQRERMRQVGMLLSGTADDAVFQTQVGAFLQGLGQSGWVIGRNVRIEARWAGSKADDIRRHAQELAALAPDVIFAHGGSTLRPLLQSTRSIPVVFAILTDPVGSGYVESLARPGRNVTGFMLNDYSLNAKYPELLKEIAPEITRVAVLRDASQGAGTGDFAVIQAMAPLLRVQVDAIDLHETGEIEIAIAAFARSPNGGLILPGSAAGRHHRDLIISLAARYKLPAVYPEHFFAAAGGLITYGPNWIDQYRLAAGYVDRILKGEKPADLPEQAPTQYEMSINLKTAKAHGLSVPATLLARADELIE
jgi:putative ABC transport system substrate-binding protein